MTGARSASIFRTMLAIALVAFATAPAGAANGGDKSALAQVRAGYAELKKKRYGAAIKEFSAALVTGKLNRNEMAKALYYRGIAYRKAKQSTKAITDFSRALWLKGALSKTEREDAESQRKAAYAEAGGSSAAPTIDSAGVAKPAPARQARRPEKRGTAAAAPEKKSDRAAAGAWQTSTTPTGAPQREARGGNAVSSFFSNLFGGGRGNGAKSNLTPTTLPRTTASVPQASAWSSKTQPRRVASKGFRTHTRPAKRGRFTIQVAALRSQGEADRVVKRLEARHGGVLGGRQPVVKRRSVGNMGALYHVELPGFTTRSAAGPVCRSLRADGLDCLVHMQKRSR